LQLGAQQYGTNQIVKALFCRQAFCRQAFCRQRKEEINMGFGRGLLLWLLGIPIPIIILLALFWHH
jgi:hypothetical protein